LSQPDSISPVEDSRAFAVTVMTPLRFTRLPGQLRFFGRWSRTPGTLLIEPGVVTLDVGRLTGHLFAPDTFPIRQARGQITLVRCRGIPGWANTAIIVSDGRRAALAVVRPFVRSSLQSALRSAGIEAEELATWFNLGTRVVSERHLHEA
jgi:hypothetical protein